MEAAGLVSRRRDPDNRRVHQVELTESGKASFHALREHAAGFDDQLRAGFTDDELVQLRGFLDRLRANATKGGS
jgi:MarR family transcriptional regulator, transcriptional regulator for hemolysin